MLWGLNINTLISTNICKYFSGQLATMAFGMDTETFMNDEAIQRHIHESTRLDYHSHQPSYMVLSVLWKYCNFWLYYILVISDDGNKLIVQGTPKRYPGMGMKYKLMDFILTFVTISSNKLFFKGWCNG
jgi:hypothetical protein